MTKKEVFKSTQGGKEVLAYLFPETADSFNGKAFRSPMREGDRTPSAHYICYDGIWYFKDFGSTGKGLNAIDAWMEVRNCDFKTALAEIAAEMGISSDMGRAMPRNAECTVSDASEDEELSCTYEEKEMTEKEMKLLCPYATKEKLEEYGFASLRSYTIVTHTKDDEKRKKKMVFSSREDYPIFCRTIRSIDARGNVSSVIHKIYQPRFRKGNDGKSYKFRYVEQGMNPNGAINGLYELHEAKKNGKHPVAVICCGERDACCVACAGFYPIWFNSESHEVTAREMALIKDGVSWDVDLSNPNKSTDAIYYIPDIDTPGMQSARALVSKFPYIKTILLDESMKDRMSDQLKPCKDLRDYMALHPHPDEFKRLLGYARRYRLVEPTSKGFSLSPDNTEFLLRMDGYAKLFDEYSQRFISVKIEGNRVTVKTPEEIAEHVREEARGYNRPDYRNAVLNRTQKLKNVVDFLKPVSLDFKSADSSSQIFYTISGNFVVNADGVFTADGKDCRYVWDEKVIKHKVTRLDPMFHIESVEYSNGKAGFVVRVDCEDCKALRFVCNMSNIHCLKEERGETLTDEEKEEKERNLTAFIYYIGHLLHRYQEKSSACAPYFTEYDRDPCVQANGGTGKTALMDMIGTICKITRIDASDKDALNGQFLYQEVDRSTDIICFDECRKGMNFARLYSLISNGVSVEKKNQDKQTIRLEDSPKTAIISNYEMASYDESSAIRRIRTLPVSHYYHVENAKAGFKETRTLRTDFGCELWNSSYSEEDWNRDINFMMQCLWFYLFAREKGFVPTPPMKEIIHRSNEAITSGAMNDWARGYYLNQDSNCNVEQLRGDVYKNYCSFVMSNSLYGIKTPPENNKFMNELKTWAMSIDGVELNPLDICNEKDRGRIRRQIKGEKVEFIYLRKGSDSRAQQELPF